MKGHKSTLLALAIIVTSGVLRLPLEARLEKQLTEHHFREGTPGLDMREQLGQMGFVAAFGGFRSLVASMLDMLAYISFSNSEWGEVDRNYALICRLQPRMEKYWELASWHMAYNAVSYYKNSNPATEQIRQAVKDSLVSDYIERGKSYLQQGLVFLPENANFHRDLAHIFRDKDPNPPKAAEHYRKAFELSQRAHLERNYAYELVKCSEPNRWREAYEILKRHYDLGDRHRSASVIRDLKILEKRLHIPVILRIEEGQ